MRDVADNKRNNNEEGKVMIKEILNYFGVYTKAQYLHQVEEVGRAMEFAMYMEKVVADMADPAKPIIILSDNTSIMGIDLQHGQQVITSPFVSGVSVCNARCLPRSK